MEGSQSGQPEMTGDPVEDPVGDLSNAPSKNLPSGGITAGITDDTSGNTKDNTEVPTHGDTGDESLKRQSDATNGLSDVNTIADNDDGANDDAKDDPIRDTKADHNDRSDDDTNHGSNNDTNGNTGSDSNGGTIADSHINTNGDTSDNTNSDTVSGSNGVVNEDSSQNTNTTPDNLVSPEDGGRISDTTIAAHDSLNPLQPCGGQTDGVRDAEKEPVNSEIIKRELKPEECEEELGYAFPTWKKWWILTVIFLIQTSMNFNTSLYSNGIPGIVEEFKVDALAARVGAAIFLISYAFGCELWAPWSEEFGRKPVLQLSLFLTNIWALPVVLAPSFTSVLVGRFLGGLSTAGGSVTLGMIPDLYDSDRQQYAVAYIVFSSVGGSVLGPIIGGFVEMLPPQKAWRWCIWIQVIFGVVVQLLHLLTVPETRTTIILDYVAKKRRELGEDDLYGPGEMYPLRGRFSWKELWDTWKRPFGMLIREPIVMFLSMLSGFSDAIIFVQIQALGLIYKQWNFTSWQIGLAFIPIAVGYFIGWMTFIPAFWWTQRKREQNPYDQWAQYESRLYPMLFLAPCLPIGLILFAWTSQGPPIPWIFTMLGTTLIGVANYAIYMATIDYMVCAYGPYSASATGGNGFARDLLAGILTLPAIPFYTNISRDGRTFQWASTILGLVSAILVWAACRIYVKGPQLRRRSPFAQHLALREEVFDGHHISVAPRPASIIMAEASEGVGAVEVAEATGFTGVPGIRTIAAKPVPGAAVDADGEMTLPVRPAFGPASPLGSYVSSVQAASRRQSRQASRNPSVNPSRRNSSEAPHDHLGTLSGERLAARLQSLGTIDSVVNES